MTAAVDLYGSEHRSVRLVRDVLNLTNRLNVINFATIFSGTAIEPPRTWSPRLTDDILSLLPSCVEEWVSG